MKQSSYTNIRTTDNFLHFIQESNNSQSQTDLKNGQKHRSTLSMDEVSLKPASGLSRPGHKRTISGTHAYFSELKTNNPERGKKKGFEKYTEEMSLPILTEIEENEPRQVSRQTEQEIKINPTDKLKELEIMVKLIEEKEHKEEKLKNLSLLKLKADLLESLDSTLTFESEIFDKEGLRSTGRLSDLLKESVNSSKTQNGPGSFFFTGNHDSYVPDFEFLDKEESSVIKNQQRSHRRRLE